MNRAELYSYIKREYGEEGLRELPKRLELADKTGTSMRYWISLSELEESNRAGPNETKLTLHEIAQRYGRGRVKTEAYDVGRDKRDK